MFELLNNISISSSAVFASITFFFFFYPPSVPSVVLEDNLFIFNNLQNFKSLNFNSNLPCKYKYTNDFFFFLLYIVISSDIPKLVHACKFREEAI